MGVGSIVAVEGVEVGRGLCQLLQEFGESGVPYGTDSRG